MVKGIVDKVVESVSIPALGDEEDVKRAREIVGDDATVYAALRAPPEFYEMQCMDYCKLALVPCFCLPTLTATRVLKSTLYIVSDKAVKVKHSARAQERSPSRLTTFMPRSQVHVDPFEPPLGIGSPTRDIPELNIEVRNLF